MGAVQGPWRFVATQWQEDRRDRRGLRRSCWPASRCLVLPGPGWLLIFIGLGDPRERVRLGRATPCGSRTKRRQGQGCRPSHNREAAGEALRRCSDEAGLGLGCLRARSILIGTSWWTDPTLVKDGRLLPAWGEVGGGAAALLRVALPAGRSRLHLLLPAQREELGPVDRTHPADFTFNIKAYSLLTNHPTQAPTPSTRTSRQLPPELLGKRFVYRDQLPDEAVDEVWQRFRDALMPLHSAGKLGAVLFQFPQWFVICARARTTSRSARRG